MNPFILSQKTIAREPFAKELGVSPKVQQTQFWLHLG